MNSWILERAIERMKRRRKKRKHFPTIDEMCKGEDGTDVIRVLNNCKAMRSVNRSYSNGYTPNKNRRYAGEIPNSIFLNPGSIFRNFFHPSMDKKERQKHIDKFFKMYPEFLVNDKR